jgi:hypothetical protein
MTDLQPVQALKTCPRCKETKSRADFSKHKRQEDGLQAQCKSCCKASNAAYYLKQKDKITLRNETWKAANPDKIKAAERKRRSSPEIKVKEAEFRQANRERLRIQQTEWRLRNPEAEKLKGQKWSRANRGIKQASLARYRASKLKRTPNWSERDLIGYVYEFCQHLNSENKAKFHVDHIYPLRAEQVCGLHVFSNLQILKGVENNSKGNRITGLEEEITPCVFTDEFLTWLYAREDV